MATKKSSAKDPWETPPPKKSRHTRLSSKSKAEAKAAAKKAGRKYPSLVDNMNAAKKQRRAGRKPSPAATKKRSPARKSAGHQKSRTTPPTRNPKGGLTAAGRRKFAQTEGAHLKPGVKKAVRDMPPQEMKRKGSWAVRFYGREKLSPLKNRDGTPTRFALTAAAWGEPVPKTEAAARKIAAKGHKLLERYQKSLTKKTKIKQSD